VVFVGERFRVLVPEWVRALRQAGSVRSDEKRELKLKAIRDAGKHSFPTADIDQMLNEIARDHLK